MGLKSRLWILLAGAVLGLNLPARAQLAPAQPLEMAPSTASPSTMPSVAPLPSSTPIPATHVHDLTDLSLEDLMNVTVNSVSKTDQNISQVAAAVTVINQDQIQRSGMTSIPELLRLSPGLDVAQVNTSTWAVSSRGFNSFLSDKLLVLMDGRTIYDPLQTGVLWDLQDYVLADLEKIEVIRGPGATLWGSNAVNGVINITTKSARDTQGLLVSTLGGNAEGEASLRYGGQLGSDTYYRVYGKFRDVNDFSGPDGSNLHDGWNASRGGFRVDKYPDSENTLTLQGDFAHAALSRPNDNPGNPVTAGGNNGNVLARWSHNESPDSGFSLQMYYDRTEKLNNPIIMDYHHDTFDLDFQDRFKLGTFQELTWGLGTRLEQASLNPDSAIALGNNNRRDYTASSYLQDDLTIVPKRVHLILGSKFEYSSYDRFQVQPSARALYTPDEHNTFWGAVSRAVRTPSLTDLDEATTLGALTDGTLSVGNHSLKPEILQAYELGYRSRPTDRLTVDIAGFYQHYSQLTTNGLIPDGNTNIINGGHGNAYGVELASEYRLSDDWRVSGSYTYLRSQAFVDQGIVLDDTNNTATSPVNQFQLHSYMDISRNVQFNVSGYEVGSVDGVPQYFRMDVGIDWKPSPGVRLGIVGQNLLEHRHLEFSRFGEPVPRSVYARLSCTY